jgi:hypothetical protein
MFEGIARPDGFGWQGWWWISDSHALLNSAAFPKRRNRKLPGAMTRRARNPAGYERNLPRMNFPR